MIGPCAKQVVRCTIITQEGKRFVGENICRNPQPSCPRCPGEDYTKCHTICEQVGHAEVVAANQASSKELWKATAYIEGHTYACHACQGILFSNGVKGIVVGQPPKEGQHD